DPGSRLRWTDDLIDVAARRGDVRVRKLRLVFRDEACALGDRVGGRGELLLVPDVHRALRAHDGDLGGGPREVHVAPDVLAAHDVVCAAVRLARDDRDLRNGRLAVRVQELGPVLDDSTVLLAYPRQEPGDVDQRDQRNVEAVAGPD